MEAGGRQILSLALASIGFLGSIIVCALSKWRVITVTGSFNHPPSEAWYGLWMSCWDWTGQIHCNSYHPSVLSMLHRDLQAARVLVVIAIVFGVFGTLLGVAGVKCTNFVPDERHRSKVAVVSGIVFIISGFFVLIPVCWSTHAIIQERHKLSSFKKVDPGAAIYIGFFSAALLFLGGLFVCISHLCSSNFRRNETDYNIRYSNSRPV